MRTLSSSVAPERLRVLSERLDALAQTHTLLAENKWAVDLTMLVRRELAPYGARARAVGPDEPLNARAALALTLTLHELATNAAKHGAFSAGNGQVDLSWRLEPENGNVSAWLVVDWSESGGPPIEGPCRMSFGTKLIRSVVPYDLRGVVELTFFPDGAACRVSIPMSEVSP
jgi:two-component system CheB/CheR fusion protein